MKTPAMCVFVIQNFQVDEKKANQVCIEMKIPVPPVEKKLQIDFMIFPQAAEVILIKFVGENCSRECGQEQLLAGERFLNGLRSSALAESNLRAHLILAGPVPGPESGGDYRGIPSYSGIGEKFPLSPKSGRSEAEASIPLCLRKSESPPALSTGTPKLAFKLPPKATEFSSLGMKEEEELEKISTKVRKAVEPRDPSRMIREEFEGSYGFYRATSAVKELQGRLEGIRFSKELEEVEAHYAEHRIRSQIRGLQVHSDMGELCQHVIEILKNAKQGKETQCLLLKRTAFMRTCKLEKKGTSFGKLQ